MKINVKAFSLSCGIVWALVVFFVTWWLIILNGASGAKTVLGNIYLGYNISTLGSLVGLAWGFVNGIVFGAFLAWLYNRLAK
ncbi:MAG TPA: hypothetical protein DEQ09_02145 [Bacteroidales bacterium]|nr:hypothetical protein [Bacteroidales bacterium]